MARFDSTLGIQLIVVFLGTILYGMGLLQCWLYFHWYPRDSWRIKTTVLAVLFFETFQTAALFAMSYNHLITNFGNPSKILVFSWWDFGQQMAVYTSALIVQFYFAYTLYAFEKKNIYCSSVIWALALVSYGSGIAMGILGHTEHFPHIRMTKIMFAIQSGASLTCDIAITTSLCVVFGHRKTGIRSTDSMLHTLTVYAVGRGVLTAIAAAVNFICFLALPGTFYFLVGLLLSGKLYMNSMLFSLNSRQHVRNQPTQDPSMIVPMDFLSSDGTQESAQQDSAKLKSSEPGSSTVADGTAKF